MQICELKVPVPWGHIAIKAWGDPTDEAVVVIHGILDNAGSFDTLIPLLPKNLYYICVDLPGHGLSSHFPSNLPLHFNDYLYAVRKVTEYFKREKYVFLGHSLGGRISVMFTQTYPEVVSKLAILDVPYSTPIPPEEFVLSLKYSFEVLDKTFTFQPERAPVYTYEEIIHKVMKSRFMGILTYETAEQLTQRMIKKVGDDKYVFTFDQRLRALIRNSYSSGYIKDMFKKYPIRCPAISIYTTTTKRNMGGRVRDSFYIPNFKFYEVKGHHHSHHTDPDLFAPILTKFLLNRKHKL